MQIHGVSGLSTWLGVRKYVLLIPQRAHSLLNVKFLSWGNIGLSVLKPVFTANNKAAPFIGVNPKAKSCKYENSNRELWIQVWVWKHIDTDKECLKVWVCIIINSNVWQLSKKVGRGVCDPHSSFSQGLSSFRILALSPSDRQGYAQSPSVVR